MCVHKSCRDSIPVCTKGKVRNVSVKSICEMDFLITNQRNAFSGEFAFSVSSFQFPKQPQIVMPESTTMPGVTLRAKSMLCVISFPKPRGTMFSTALLSYYICMFVYLFI